MMTTKIATSPRLPNVINGGAGSPVRRASVPTAVSSGAAYGQKTPRATARSTPMRVPRKPHTIKGPWAMKRVGHGKGQAHPNRTSPPHSAVSKASRPSAMRGKRTLLSIGNTFNPELLVEMLQGVPQGGVGDFDEALQGLVQLDDEED